jgi:hypothetical protein
LRQPQYPFAFPLTAPCPPHLTCRGPLKVAGWALHLRNHPDQSYVNSLLDIITFGAKLGYTGPDQLVVSDNLASALLQPDDITSDIEKRIALLQIRRIDTVPSKYICSPLGLTPKSDGGWRRIHHLSHPPGRSVNDHIPREWGSLVYTQFDEAVSTVLRAGPHCLLVKRDLADAFRHIPVHPDDWWLLGFRWENAFYQDLFLPFGLRTSPAIFDLFATALEWIARREVQMQHTQHYLDDFLMVIPAGSDNQPQPLEYAKVSRFETVCADVGFRIKDSKSEEGTQLTFLGIELDSVAMEARLPRDKHVKAIELVNAALRHPSLTRQELDSLVGFLSFASRVIPASRPFLRRLYDAQGHRDPRPRRPSSSTRHTPVRGAVKRDLQWWQEFLPQWNGIRLLQPSRLQAYLWTDASGTKGIGGYFLLDRSVLPQRSQVFSRMVPQRHKKKHINYKEMFAVLQALQLWLASFAGRRVHVYCDNEAVVTALRKQTIRGNAISPLRKIAMLAALHDVQLTIHWIATAENALADALSRWDWARVANMCPHLQVQELSALLQ